MTKLEDKKVAIVCDWIKDWGGAELVLEQLMEIFPRADIFTSVFFQEWNPLFEKRKITSSFIQNIPILNKSHKLALTLRPQAFESFDLSEYDIVISSSSAESKWVITKPETLHICYCHTPTRYFWSHFHEYMSMTEFGILNPLAKWLMPKMIHKLRIWDFAAAQRPDYFIANSQNTAARIEKYYKRESSLIYPCIDVSQFQNIETLKKEAYYLWVGRCIPYKKFDLLVDAFNINGRSLVLVTNTDNKLYKKLKEKSKKNITWIFAPERKELEVLYAQARAFVFPPEEDFGLVPIEAMALGTPVIAYGKWWALETVLDRKTGIFFEKQSVESLNTTIEHFETLEFDSEGIKKYAEKFDKQIFKTEILEFIEEKLQK